MLGAACFLSLQGLFQLTWDQWFRPAQLPEPWFLGSRRSLLITQLVLALAAWLLSSRPAEGWRDRFLRSGAMTAGVLVAVSCTFFLTGPERLMVGPPRLWPMVLLSALLLLAPAVVVGTLLGGLGWALPTRSMLRSTLILGLLTFLGLESITVISIFVFGRYETKFGGPWQNLGLESQVCVAAAALLASGWLLALTLMHRQLSDLPPRAISAGAVSAGFAALAVVASGLLGRLSERLPGAIVDVAVSLAALGFLLGLGSAVLLDRLRTRAG